MRHSHGKSDDADAAGAAAAVLAGEALGEPKTTDGAAEMARVLRVARTSVVRARVKAYTALQSLLVTAPDALREQLAGLNKDRLLQACLQLAEPAIPTTPADALTIAIRSPAARCRISQAVFAGKRGGSSPLSSTGENAGLRPRLSSF